MLFAASCMTRVPTSVEPVKLILCDAWVGDQSAGHGRAWARQDRQRSIGQAGLGQDLGHRQRGERRLRCRLHDRRVPARERRRDLPRGDRQREVPRGDQHAYPHGFADRDVDPRRDDRDRLAEDLVRGAAPVLERIRHDVDLAAGRRDRLAAVPRLELRQLLQAFADQERRLGQDATALARAGPRPRTLLERLSRQRRRLDVRPRPLPRRPRPWARPWPARSPRTSCPRRRRPAPRRPSAAPPWLRTPSSHQRAGGWRRSRPRASTRAMVAPRGVPFTRDSTRRAARCVSRARWRSSRVAPAAWAWWRRGCSRARARRSC